MLGQALGLKDEEFDAHSFRTELEPEEYNRRQHGAVGVTAAALEDYACRICNSPKGVT